MMHTAQIISYSFNKRVQSFKFMIAVIHILQHHRVLCEWWLTTWFNICVFTHAQKCIILFQELTVGGCYGRGTGSISLDINALDQSVNQNTQIGESLTEFTIGSESFPLPIHTKVVPIVEALADNLWNANEWTSIRQKRTHLRRALQNYATYKRAAIAQGSCLITEWACVRVSMCTWVVGWKEEVGWRYILCTVCIMHI